jgi:hypothetical protein
MVKSSLLALLIIASTGIYAQRLRYKTDIEPIIKTSHSVDNIGQLERYYRQYLGTTGKPDGQTIVALRESMAEVCLYAGRSLEREARKYKEYPTTDSAIALLENAKIWYSRIGDDYFVKSDTLEKHIAKVVQQQKNWKQAEADTRRSIETQKSKLEESLAKLAEYNKDIAQKLRAEHSNRLRLSEYQESNRIVKAALDKAAADYETEQRKLEYEQKMEAQKLQAAQERRERLIEQQANERKQREFLLLQEQCMNENPCPNCPVEVAKIFRDAYHSGDINAMKSMVIDYYGDKKIFYYTDLDLFKNYTETELHKMRLQLRARTADYKVAEPAGVVFYTDNEEKDFFIDKNYKSELLHATVFKLINDHDKIDLVKYNGQWKVYRVGGAYGGRSGNTIINGRFFFDPVFLQKEIKERRK